MAEVEGGIVVLDVELPAVAGPLQAIKNGRHLDPVGWDALPQTGILGANPVLVVGQATTHRRREETVGEDIVVGKVPVQRDVASVVVAERQGSWKVSVLLRHHKSVHAAAVVRG